ncbi:hypothetical protein ACSVDM_21475 [Nocardia sp. JW2]|uniref:hypothetical protein n=1 Tax=Nocardia sp. JW2 TaxID=3450738 RepID=UPI003F441780
MTSPEESHTIHSATLIPTAFAEGINSAADEERGKVATELVRVMGQAGALQYPDWTHVVSTGVRPSRGVSTWEVIAYRGSEGAVVSLFDHREIDRSLESSLMKLFAAQGETCMGLKCSVARSGQFRIEYSYDIDEAIKWANQVFSGLPPEELVEILRPTGDL